jgi:hypothetical protein
MTDPEPSPHDEQVRRLLADARHDAPLPPDVAARLDDVLADLTAERDAAPVAPPPLGPPPPPHLPPSVPPSGPSSAPVVDLGARRRRRQGAALLLAAAAVVAIGVGVGSMVDDQSGGTADSASSGESQERLDSDSADRAQPDDGGGAAAPSELPAVPPESGALMRMRPVLVSSDTFAADAERYRALTQDRPTESGGQSESDGDFACASVDLGAGVKIPALYDGMEAVLVYRPPTDDAQVVDLLQCGTADVLRTTTLPAP